MTPADVFPHATAWVSHLQYVWPAYIIKPQFASWEVFHILSLILLGGTSILINLRLLGLGVTNEPPSEVWRNLRLWLNLGVAGIVVSGLLIGMANAERLYNSNAFTVKMACLLAGIILTYGVSVPVAKADGVVSAKAKGWLVAGLVVFGFGLWVFATSRLINPGLFHLMTAAALIVLFVTRGRARMLYLAVLLVLVVAQWIGSHIVVSQTDFAHLDPLNKGFAVAFALWIFGFAGQQLFAARRELAYPPLTQVIGYLSILVWVTAGAAGRWIAFA